MLSKKMRLGLSVLPLCGLGLAFNNAAFAQTAQTAKTEAAAKAPSAEKGKHHAAAMRAHDSIAIKAPWAREMLPNAKVGAGYFEIENNTDKMVRLTKVESEAARKVEIHSMKMEGDVMKMRHLKEGVEIAPHSGLSFKPGSYHLMFIDPKTPFKTGEKIETRFIFADGKGVEVPFTVRAAGKDAEAGHAPNAHKAKAAKTAE